MIGIIRHSLISVSSTYLNIGLRFHILKCRILGGQRNQDLNSSQLIRDLNLED